MRTVRLDCEFIDERFVIRHICQGVQICEEQNRRDLLCRVELGRATRLLLKDGVNIVEGLLET